MWIAAVALLAALTFLAGLWLITGAWRHVAAFLMGLLLFQAAGMYLTTYVFHQAGVRPRMVYIPEWRANLIAAVLADGAVTLSLIVGMLVVERALKRQVRERDWSHSLLAGVLITPVALAPGWLVGGRFPGLALGLAAAAFLALPVLYCLAWLMGKGNEPC